MNTLQFLVDSCQRTSAVAGWDSSYHMCRNHFVLLTPSCSQLGNICIVTKRTDSKLHILPVQFMFES